MAEVRNILDNIEEHVMGELKDFQKVTVERIDYLYRNGHNRILLSDEVGLGKTKVAKGVIAKFANLRKEEDDHLVKVIYICSNSTIVDQNLDSLRIASEITPENSYTSRLSMQHLNIFEQEYDEDVLKRYIQLIPLTPETSFSVSNSQGTVDERALMFAILKRHPKFENYIDKLEEIFRFGVKYWEDTKNYWDIRVWECNNQSNGDYEDYIINEVDKYHDDLEKLIKLCQKNFDKKSAKPHIVQFRKIFADISLNRLDPDLIIMDEFQRFRHLLNSEPGSEMEKLTTKFFKSGDVRILMLSATPYKMYSTLDEISEEDVDAHYSEFLDVINFLKENKNEQEKFTDIWEDYSIKLKEICDNRDSFIIAKSKAEDELYKNICRTERITETELADIIDSDDAKNSLTVLEEDITSYMEAQKLLDECNLKINVPVDYIKSAPYIMSFMKHYQLKRKIEKYFRGHPEEISRMQKPTFWLNEEDINDYNEIPCNNARLTNLMDYVFENNSSNLLWIPPSLPYYELGGAFKDCEYFSKTLIFSSWEMVPRMISSLVSYEAERQTIGNLKRDIKYFSPRRYPSPRLRFSVRDNSYNMNNISMDRTPAQMSLFTLLYPSVFLADTYVPIDCLNENLSLNEIENDIKSKIKGKLDKLQCNEDAGDDKRWYYLAPLFLDSIEDVSLWFNQLDALMESNNFSGKSFIRHFDFLKKLYFEFSADTRKLGRKPDDLVDILCDMAFASPAICAHRSYENELPQNSSMDFYRCTSTQIARKFIGLMNLPESIAAIDSIFDSNSRDAHWKNVLRYSKDGNLQAVFDEYVHILAGPLNKNDENRIDIINNKFLSSFNFRTTSYDIDTFSSFKSRIENGDKSSNYLRTHYAASFTKGKSEESDTNRQKTVLNAFNSPFRPFVLASTSIGQEGLDFHNYCRRIVHWNLPSNPIDLEQREGRINRFECLAIRQNVANRYGNNEFKNNIWKELFEIASETEKTGNSSDLIPHWGLKESEDMVKIERIVPMYPFSRDETSYDRLIKILSLYRLTLGQPRQEELLETIFDNEDVDENEIKELFINLSPYYKED